MKVKRYFKDISPKAWEHPADRAALVALRQAPGFSELLRKIIGATTEKSIRLITLSSSVRVSERQFPKVHTLAREVGDVLDIDKNPEIYVSQNPLMNAGVFGVMNPFVTLNSAMIERLSDEELLAVLGHEIGHCVSGHALYKTLLWLIVNIFKQVLMTSSAKQQNMKAGETFLTAYINY
jgi:Zn-dependent protease with chaperone function